MKEIVEKLTELNKTISAMESCTGGFIANQITNIEGASNVLRFSAVTYSNEFKIKMGVDKSIIDKYTVYSIETAKEMSKQIALFSHSNYGIGVTGKINRVDINNLVDEDNLVYVSIYNADTGVYYPLEIKTIEVDRNKNKEIIATKIEELLASIIL